MSLPLKAIDRLFDRLLATYGSEFSRLYEGIDNAGVKTVWAHELAVFSDKLEFIAWGLENLPERPPNAIQFRNLCRTMPAPPERVLEAPKADPERLKAELSKLGSLKMHLTRPLPTQDQKQWARNILAGIAAGDRRTPAIEKLARDALKKDAA